MIVDKPTLSKHPHNRYSLIQIQLILIYHSIWGFDIMPPPPTSNLEGTGGHYTVLQGFEGNVGKSPRKSQVHLVLVVHVGGNLKEKSRKICTAGLLGSGTYLECSGCSIANRQNPSESKMVLYWRKKSCQSIQPLCRYAQGGC